MSAPPAPVPQLVREIAPETLLLMPPLSGPLQPYVPREVDAEFDRALAAPGFVVIQADPFGGARRTAYEALLRGFFDTSLVTHEPGGPLDADATVLWADFHTFDSTQLIPEFQRLQAWRSRPGPRWVLAFVGESTIQTLRRELFAALRPHVIHVKADLSEAERSRLTQRGLDENLGSVSAIYSAFEHEAADTAPAPPTPRTGSDDDRGPHASGYHPDTDHGADRLGVTADVHMLADLVASRHVTPPLSIGLFGDWGAGKSFFMRQMRIRIDDLAAATAHAEQAAGQRGPAVSSYCASIRQITFNAWHYAESNLWASLATHLLDHLASSGPSDDLERHADDLAAQRRDQRSMLDQLSSVRVERMLLTARVERLADATPSATDLATAFTRTLAEERWSAAAPRTPPVSPDQLRRFVAEATGPASQLRTFWRRAAGSRATWLTLVLGAAAVAVAVVVAQSALWPALIAAGAAAASLAPALRAVRASAHRVRRAAEQVTERAAEPFRVRLAELDAEQDRLERAIGELAPSQDLAAFARSRVDSPDYRQHLGVVSLLRRDLERFAALLAADRSAGAGPERIVLYIDDLDRCPPAVVVKVLEAVHLLLAQPVFAIVVGADAQWLINALRQHYGPVLDGGGPDGALRYLEKIFQIPLTLAPMSTGGFTALVTELGRDGAPAADEPVPTAGAAVATPRVERPDGAVRAPSGPSPGGPRTPAPASARQELRPPRLAITQAELDCFTAVAPLVRSPRGAKRLVNLYRLLRARLQDGRSSAFASEPGYRAAIVLLAVMVGPADETALFEAIEAAESATVSELLGGSPEWESSALARLVSSGQAPDDLDAYRRWLPLIRRFGFGRA